MMDQESAAHTIVYALDNKAAFMGFLRTGPRSEMNTGALEAAPNED